jgi:hypothetical protein
LKFREPESGSGIFAGQMSFATLGDRLRIYSCESIVEVDAETGAIVREEVVAEEEEVFDRFLSEVESGPEVSTWHHAIRATEPLTGQPKNFTLESAFKRNSETTKGVTMSRKAQEVLRLVGDPVEVDRSLRSFQEAAKVLSSDHPRLIDKYPKQWIAVHNGHVKATASTYNALLAQMDRDHLPRDETIIRFIDRNQRTMILSNVC